MFNHDAIDMNTIPPLQCDSIENVTLLPMVGDITGDVSTYALGAYKDKQALPYTRRMTTKDKVFHTLPHIKPWKFSEEEVIYGGIFFMHWGHFLLENLQRLWYAQKNNLPIVWVGVNGYGHTPSQFKTWQSDIFQALGIHNTHIFLKEPTEFAKVHFPEPGSGINTHIHPEHANFLGFYEATPVQRKYVYLSRSKIRGCANEVQLEKTLKKRGWHIIHPETLSVAQQLEAISTAKVCLMIGGSAQHSLLLTKKLQTRFIIIPREHTETFNIIANYASDNYYLFHLEKQVLYSAYEDEANDLFTLDLVTLQQILEQTQDFTQDLNIFPQLFTKPEKLLPRHITVPSTYYTTANPSSKARTLFYIAYFFYQQKKYRAAYKIFLYLEKKELLEDFMYLDFFMAVQQYHIQNDMAVSAPLKKYHYHVQLLYNKMQKAPQETRFYKKLTDIYLIAGNFEAALQLQRELMQRNPHWSKPLAQIASIYSAQGNTEKAIEYAKKAIDIEPHSLKRKSELVHYLIKNKDFTSCKKLLAQALLHTPSWHEAYVHLAHIHHSVGDFDKAYACIQKAVAMAPQSFEAQEQLATFLNQQGKHNAAIETLAKALQQNPRHAERHAQSARIFAHMKNFDKAIEHATKAVELEPRNFVCKAHLATYLQQNKQYQDLIKLMTEVMHINPFWSEPHAQFAAMHHAQGNLSKAIDCARKAVSVEPFDVLRKKELYNLRAKNFLQLPQEQKALLPTRYSTTWARIQSYIDIFYAKTYLEIGVENGHTFLNLDVPFKMGVDPNFLFDTSKHATETTRFYHEKSDIFFEHLPQRAATLQHIYHNGPFKFDIIFIDGLHTFKQTLQDFENSLAYAHENTLWIIDDTIPSHHFSAMNSQEKSILWKSHAGLCENTDWHGDVFKAIFAIHDNYPEFSYCTQTDNGNPQTLLWRTPKPVQREKIFASEQAIAQLRYEDFVENAWIMYLVDDAQVLEKIFTPINPLHYKTGEEYKKIITPLVSDNERMLKKRNEELQRIITDLHESQKVTGEGLEHIRKEVLKLTEINKSLLAENRALKKN